MPRPVAALILVALAACSEPTPPSPPPMPPKPVVKPKPEAQAPQANPVAQTPVKADPNAELASRVKRALEDEAKVQAAAIDVTAAGGKVTLWGTASSDDERARAVRVAGKVQGVTAVENRIAVVRGS